MASYLILDVVFSVLVVAAIVGALVWSIASQHRDHGCEEVRLRLAFPARRRATARKRTPAAIRTTTAT